MLYPIDTVLGPRWPHINILDIGAMLLPGETEPYRPIMKPGKFSLYGFEAVKAECDKLNAAAKPGQRYLNYVVGDGSGRMFTETNTSMTSSIYEPNTPLLKMFNNLHELTVPTGSSPVQTIRLDDVPELCDQAIDFIKLDVQGAECDVFSGASRALSQAVAIHTEVEFVQMYKGQPLYGDVAAKLQSAGFMHHTFMFIAGRTFWPLIVNNNINQNIRQQLWADAVFVRHPETFDDLEPDQLLKLAIIAHELYQSADLAQLSLAKFDRKVGTQVWESYMAKLIGAGTLPAKPQ